MQFNYNFVNADHIPKNMQGEVRDALDKKVYICQQHFEKALDVMHEINVLDKDNTTGEAFVAKVEINNNIAEVDLDFSNIKVY